MTVWVQLQKGEKYSPVMILKGLGAKTSWSKIANCKVILL
jgi:hypothetical protein